MKKMKSNKGLGRKELSFVLPLGRKKINVYNIKEGKGIGLGIVQCSLYPNLGGVFSNLEKAIERAYKIKRFDEKQMNLIFEE